MDKAGPGGAGAMVRAKLEIWTRMADSELRAHLLCLMIVLVNTPETLNEKDDADPPPVKAAVLQLVRSRRRARIDKVKVCTLLNQRFIL